MVSMEQLTTTSAHLQILTFSEPIFEDLGLGYPGAGTPESDVDREIRQGQERFCYEGLGVGLWGGGHSSQGKSASRLLILSRSCVLVQQCTDCLGLSLVLLLICYTVMNLRLLGIFTQLSAPTF